MPSRNAEQSIAEVDEFIERWSACEGGQERANYALFLTELCRIIGVAPPNPANADPVFNDYVFERVVDDPHFREEKVSQRRIDLYKRGCFVLEAKQSRLRGGSKEMEGQLELLLATEAGRHPGKRKWDVLMMNARRQAEGYARALPPEHGWPPFIIVCDVGHCLELYADFSAQGKNYAQYPDRQGFRIFLKDLRKDKTRQLLRTIWNEPLTLDPTRQSADVTSKIASRLAAVSKALEKANHSPEKVAAFLMRCIFTMFAEDVGLLPKQSFRDVLAECQKKPDNFVPMVQQLWQAMDEGAFAFAIKAKVKKFNGAFFKDREVFPLGREEIGELEKAAGHSWKEVEPAIFGTLLEQALEPADRRKLGAHYTPRAYVERLVNATVMEPLRDEWVNTLSTAERQQSDGRMKDAIQTLNAFHDRLCSLRVLDPACGTGNFLYVAMELLKRLEGEVLEAITSATGQDYIPSLQSHTVDPHQFIGMEINPRAAAIAELVLWIGYLQWHFRITNSLPSEPILQAFKNIQERDAVKLNPTWPEAEFIVGNPPFIGGKDIRARLGNDYVEALWAAHPNMNESADYVMYWWEMAAERLTRKGAALKRFGFVTTNSVSQVFQRRVMERHMRGKKPLSLVMAIPDHPWTKAGKDAAAVRIAMTVAEAGVKPGRLLHVTGEAQLDTDTPDINFSEETGAINPDLTVGVDITSAITLLANDGVCSPGMKLHGAGFIVSPQEAGYLGLGKRPGLEKHVRQYRNGKDLTSRPRKAMVIDLFGLSIAEVRARYPEVYQHLLLSVKPERDSNNRDTYKQNWWIFGEPRRELRPALAGLQRYIATVETAKHRYSIFVGSEILPDNRLICFALSDAFHLGIISSRIHIVWALANGGTLEDRPIYTKSRCFDPFPFPKASESQKKAIRAIAEELDAFRKERLTDHPALTLTDIYNVLEKVRAGAEYGALKKEEQAIFADGLILMLKETHERLDKAVCAAYGWPDTLSDAEILERLVALNFQRREQEKEGMVQWLRPEYQEARFGTPAQKQKQMEADLVATVREKKKPFPAGDMNQTAEVMAVFMAMQTPLSAADIASRYRKSPKTLQEITKVLVALCNMGFAIQDKDTCKYILRHASYPALSRVA